MKTYLPLLLSLITTITLWAQSPAPVIPPYDSLSPMVANVYQLIGQDLIVKSKPAAQHSYGYEDFYLNYITAETSGEENVYKCCETFHSIYDSMAGRVFHITDIIPHPQALTDPDRYGTKVFLKLRNTNTDEVVYFSYNTARPIEFPFVIQGYMTKRRRQNLNKMFAIRPESIYSKRNILTGYSLTIQLGLRWRVIDLVIDTVDQQIKEKLQNSAGEQILLDLKTLKEESPYDLYSEKELAAAGRKYGAADADLIGKGMVRIGMKEDACHMSWGEPDHINRTYTNNYVDEQWVYEHGYLYLRNGVLTSYQTF